MAGDRAIALEHSLAWTAVARRRRQLSSRLPALLRDPDDEGAVLDRHVRALALGRADLLGEGARDPQGEAIAPFHEFGPHPVLLPRIYNVSQGWSKKYISNRRAHRHV